MKKNMTKELIINKTLQMIDTNNGIKNVTLRTIAKEIGCAHTNIYNYYGSLDDIFWDSLGEVLMIMMDTVGPNEDSKLDDGETILLLLSNLVDFYMEHPGWYRLIWLEDIGGSPSPSVQATLKKPGEDFITELMSNHCNSIEMAQRYSDILIHYLHGEINSWVNHRNNTERSTHKQIIMQNIRLIMDLFTMKEAKTKYVKKNM